MGYFALRETRRGALCANAFRTLHSFAPSLLESRQRFDNKGRETLIDELGYLPLDKVGTDLLFQIISQRYERGAIVITTNKAFKRWPEIFNNDAGVTSAILDRVLHGAETVIIEGKSDAAGAILALGRGSEPVQPPPQHLAASATG